MPAVPATAWMTPSRSPTACCGATGLQHASVIKLVREHLADFREFGEVAFETRLNPQGSPTEYAELNEPQAALLFLYQRNTKAVRAFKLRMVKDFARVTAELQRLKAMQAAPAWQAARVETKRDFCNVADMLQEVRAGAGKEGDAQAIAEGVGCQWVEMPADSPANFDANDYAAQHGGEALGELLERVQSPPVQEPPPPRFRLLTGDDLRNLPALRWRIKGVLPAVGVAAVYGPSGSGKSFLCFDLAAAVAAGMEWFGHRVKAAPVVYLPLEGEAGFRLRADAWEAEQGRRLPDGLALVMDPFKLTDPEDVAALAEVVSSTGHEPVVIVDTLNRSAPDCDENASADMGRVIEGAKGLQRLAGGLVILVHHTGKDAGKGMRGHSSLFAALDAAIEVTRDDDRRAWKGGKVKDGEDGKDHPFRLQVHELGEDEDGDTITSCAVRMDTSAGEAQRPRHPKGGNQRIVLDALLPLFKAGTAHGKGGALATVACVELEAAITAGAACLACEKDRRRERARLSITGLISAGVLGCGEGWLWLK